MDFFTVSNCIENQQHNLYKLVRSSSTTKGRLFSPLIALTDIGLEVIKSLVLIIEHTAHSAIDLIKEIFSKNYTLKHKLHSLQDKIVLFPKPLFFALIRIAFSPVNFIFQTGAIIVDPKNTKPFFYIYDLRYEEDYQEYQDDDRIDPKIFGN